MIASDYQLLQAVQWWNMYGQTLFGTDHPLSVPRKRVPVLCRLTLEQTDACQSLFLGLWQ